MPSQPTVKPLHFRPERRPRPWPTAWLLGLVVTVCSLPGSGLWAQTIYRNVGSDGRVTFSDIPSHAAAAKVAPTDSAPASTARSAAPATLPFELRQVASRYPVTLYSTSNCSACDSARKFLLARGIPLSEKTVTTAQDIEALQRLSGSGSVPILTVGKQLLQGFSEIEWAQYLSAAGYPARSQLPPAYVPEPATPLVSVQSVPPQSPVAPAPEAARLPAPPLLPQPSPANPAGIQF